MKRRTLIMSILCICFAPQIFSQYLSAESTYSDNNLKFKYSALIIPVGLITYGVVGLKSDGLLGINAEVKEEVNEHIDNKLTIDNFSQYAPALSVYALNAAGVEGKNNFKDRTIILATSYIIMGATVFSLKNLTKEMRPDDSSRNSWPSGHTATAFMGAEFLRQEFKDRSAWYGIAGYAVATGTGLFRIYNNRHWLTDVVAGAGVGILSTKIAYWVNPFFKEKIFKSKGNKHITSIAYPYYNGQQASISLALHF